MQSYSRVVCLMGPTASGKTDFALNLVDRFPFEIVSVDSAMVYRGMDIGTAKPSSTILERIPHHLINICDPATPYSVAMFCQQANRVIDTIFKRGKWPLLVGGSMLYFHLLQQGFTKLPSANLEIRAALSKEWKQKGAKSLYRRLASIDPKAAARLHEHDVKRVQRALEVHEVTGQTMTDLQSSSANQSSPWRFLNIVLLPRERAFLHRRIVERFASMLKNRFLEEVSSLKKRRDLNKTLPSMCTVGYRQAWAYLNGEYDQQTMQERAVVATRQLAKRQLTWLRRWPQAEHFYMEDNDRLDQIERLLEKNELKV